jgi:hypothetical protein
MEVGIADAKNRLPELIIQLLPGWNEPIDLDLAATPLVLPRNTSPEFTLSRRSTKIRSIGP